MKNHLLAIESSGQAGKLLAPQELHGLVKSIKVLSARGPDRARPDLKNKTVKQMLEEASRHPEVAKALALMGG